MSHTLRLGRRSNMEILLPHNTNDEPHVFEQQPSKASSIIQHCSVRQTLNNCVDDAVTKMHRARNKPAGGNDDNWSQNNPPDSSNDDDDEDGNITSSSKVRNDEVPMYVQVPLPYDVLGSQDRNSNKHPGNQVYRKLIEDCASLYKSKVTKQEKMDVSRMILTTMVHRYGSRFLRSCSDNINIGGGGGGGSGSLPVTERNVAAASQVVVTRRQQRNKRNETASRLHANSSNNNAVIIWQVMCDKEARDKITHAIRTYNQKKLKDTGNVEILYTTTTGRGTTDGIVDNYIGNRTTTFTSTTAGSSDDTTTNHAIATRSPIDIGHYRNHDMDQNIGLYKWDESFDIDDVGNDHNNLSFDDSNALLGLLNGPLLASSSPITSLNNSSNEIQFDDDDDDQPPVETESMNRKPISSSASSTKRTGSGSVDVKETPTATSKRQKRSGGI